MRGNSVHFDILVEDQSGKKALDFLIPKIIGDGHTFTIHPYKGIGRIPKNLNIKKDSAKRILLDQLPKLLRGYGNTYSTYPNNYKAAVIVVCDLDDKCIKTFRKELFSILDACNPKPETRFCIAIEEGEAWFLGDLQAVRTAYPKAKNNVLSAYVQDSICDTWEKLADAIYPGGSNQLRKQHWTTIGTEKSNWAEAIAPKMDVENNQSGSFCYFRDKLRELANSDH